MEENKIKRLASFFYEIGILRKIPRAHQQTLLSQDLSDNIASHSFRATFIGYFLAKELKADANKIMKMCLLHDIEESRCGDQNWIHKRYVKTFDEQIRNEQFKNVVNSEELKEISREYQERKTLEAKIAKDADLLDQILILKEYQMQGNKEAEDWLKRNREDNAQEKLMFTDLAKKISREIKKQDPSFWWESIWTSKRRK